MAFWNAERELSTGVFEPFRQFRWFLEMPGVIDDNDGETEDLRYSIKECTLPSVSVKVHESLYLGTLYKFPTLHSWKPIQVKMVSTAGEYNSSFNSYNIFSRFFSEDENLYGAKTSRLIQSVKINQLDFNGVILQNWVLFNAFFSDVNFGNLSYENDGFLEISCTITYDYSQTNIFGYENGEEIKNSASETEDYVRLPTTGMRVKPKG